MRYITRHRQRLASLMALLSFGWILGAVGDMELSIAGMLESIVRIGIRLIVCGSCVYLEGALRMKEKGGRSMTVADYITETKRKTALSANRDGQFKKIYALI